MSFKSQPLSLAGLNVLGSETTRQRLFYNNYPIKAGVHLRWNVERELAFPRGENNLRYFVVERFNTQSKIFEIIPTDASPERAFQIINDFAGDAYTNIKTIPVSHNPDEMASRLEIFDNAEELKSFYQPTILQLSQYLQQLLANENEIPLHRQAFSTENKGRIGMNLPILDGMMMAALDPFVAAILGLYYIDYDPPPTGYNIYRITGSWKIPWPPDHIHFNSYSIQEQSNYHLQTDSFRIASSNATLKLEDGEDGTNAKLLIYSAVEASINIYFHFPVQEVRIHIENLRSLLWRVAISGTPGITEDTEQMAAIGDELVLTNIPGKPFRHIELIVTTPQRWRISSIRFRTKTSFLGDISSNPFPLMAESNSASAVPPILCKVKEEKIPPILDTNGMAVRKSQVSIFSKIASIDYNDFSRFTPALFTKLPYLAVRLQFGKSEGLTAVSPTTPALSLHHLTGNPSPVIYHHPQNYNQHLVLYLPLNGNIKETAFEIPVTRHGRAIFEKVYSSIKGEKSLFFSGQNCLTIANHATLKNFPDGFAVKLFINIHESNHYTSGLIGNTNDSFSLGLFKTATARFRLRAWVRGRSFDSTIDINIAIWTMVAVSYDNDKIRFFINDSLDYNAEGNPEPGPVPFNAGNLFIGAEGISSFGAFINPFRGNMRNITIWNSASSLPDLQDTFHRHPPSSLGAPARSLVLQHFNEIILSTPENVVTLSPDTEIKKITNQFSIFLEVNPVAGQNFPTLIGNNYTQSFWLGLQPGDYRLRFWLNNRVYLSNTGVPPNVWTRVGISYDGQKLTFFINNVSDNIIEGVNGLVMHTETPLKIGADVDNSYPFKGKIKDISIYNVALSPEERKLFKEENADEIISHPQFIDRNVANNTYSYFAQGIDIFGRVSAWSHPQSVNVNYLPEYSAPVNIKAQFVPLSGRVLQITSEEADGTITFEYAVDINARDTATLEKLITFRYGAEFIDGSRKKHVFEINPILDNTGNLKHDSDGHPVIQFKKPLFTSFSPSVDDNFIVLFDAKIQVSWAWTGLQQVYNPEVSQFQIFMRNGPLNEVEGIIETITEIPDEERIFDIRVVSQQILQSNELAEEFISIQNRLYKILYHSSGQTIDFRIEYLGNPVIKPAAGNWIRINLPVRASVYEDFSQVENWGLPVIAKNTGYLNPLVNYTPDTVSLKRILIEDWQGLAGRGINWISRESVESGIVCTIEFNEFLRPPETGNTRPENYIPSALTLFTTYPDSTAQWECYYLLWHEWMDEKLVAYCLLKGKDNEPVPLPVIVVEEGTPARLYVGTTFSQDYEVEEAPEFLNGASTLPYHIAITAADTAERQGDLSQKATMIATDRGHPPKPPKPNVQIGKPDYYNLSLATISWDTIDGCTFQLYRATDASVFTRDLELRRKKQGFYATVEYSNLLEDDEDFEDWFACFKNKDPEKVTAGLGSRLRTLTIAELFPPEINPEWNKVTALWKQWAQQFYTDWSGPATPEEDLYMRRNRTGPYKSITDEHLNDVFSDDGGFDDWFGDNNDGFGITDLFPNRINPLWQEVTPIWRAWADRFYPSLEDEILQGFAEREGNETAFTVVNKEPITESSYIEQIKGSVSNRYFYRLRTQGNNQLRSTEWGAVSDAQRAALKSLPPRTPVFTKVEAGDRQITLQWALNREPDLKEYLLYRSDTEAELNDSRWWTTELDPRIVARIADPRITVIEGNINLPFELSTENILGIYRLDEFNGSAEPLDYQPQALNYYKQPIVSAMLTQLQKSTHLKGIANGVEVVIVSRNESGEIQKLVTMHEDYPYVDEGLVGLRNYYYKLVAVNNIGVKSEMSKVTVGKALDSFVPESPDWISAEWMRVLEDGTLLSISSELGTSVTVLQWIKPDNSISVTVQKKTNAGTWKDISDNLENEKNQFIDRHIELYKENEYRLKVYRNSKSNSVFKTIIVQPIFAHES